MHVKQSQNKKTESRASHIGTHVLETQHQQAEYYQTIQKARLAPMSLSPKNISLLQRTIGNRAIQQLVQEARSAPDAQLQRDTETEDPERTQTETDSLDAELDALLDQIFGQAPEIPAFEAITSTTAGEYSRGELESEIERLWRRERISFTQAARQTAQNNTPRRRGPRATQSAELQPSVPYAKRWAVNLFAADYQGRSDLPDVSDLMRRGSPFQRSLAAEFTRVIPVRNPTASEMQSQIFDAIHDLWLSLEENQIGELVITFSGHGGNGSISGVDWEELSPQDLSNMAEMARDFNIHVIYVLDTCRAGILAGFAQAAAVSDLQERSENLSESQQASIQVQINGIKGLGRFGAQISGYAIRVGDAARDNSRHRTTENYLTLFNSLSELFDKVSDFGEHIQQDNPFLEGISNLATLREQQSDLLLAIIVAYNGNRSSVNQALRSTAVLLDELNDSINRAITQVNTSETPTTSETEQVGQP
jgi:hypothetical protein